MFHVSLTLCACVSGRVISCPSVSLCLFLCWICVFVCIFSLYSLCQCVWVGVCLTHCRSLFVCMSESVFLCVLSLTLFVCVSGQKIACHSVCHCLFVYLNLFGLYVFSSLSLSVSVCLGGFFFVCSSVSWQVIYSSQNPSLSVRMFESVSLYVFLSLSLSMYVCLVGCSLVPMSVSVCLYMLFSSFTLCSSVSGRLFACPSVCLRLFSYLNICICMWLCLSHSLFSVSGRVFLVLVPAFVCFYVWICEFVCFFVFLAHCACVSGWVFSYPSVCLCMSESV